MRMPKNVKGMSDPISRQAAIDELNVAAELLRLALDDTDVVGVERAKYEWGLGVIESLISDMEELPSAQPERCEYYALCRHGRDENKLRAHLGFCEYCNEDADGFVAPIEKN